MHTHRSVMCTAVAGVALATRVPGRSVGARRAAVVPRHRHAGQHELARSTTARTHRGAAALGPRRAPAMLIQRYGVTAWSAITDDDGRLPVQPAARRVRPLSLRRCRRRRRGDARGDRAKAQDVIGLQYIEGYGMSETMAATHINPPQRPKQQCLGIPIFDVDSRVVDPDTLRELPPGEVGEIIVHGPQVFQGYWNQPEATARPSSSIDGKRFFRTGDLGLLRRGRLLLHHRPPQAHDQRGRLQGLAGRSRGDAVCAPGDPGSLRHRRARSYRGETVKAVVVLKARSRGAVSRADIMRLGARQDGRLQGAAHRGVRRRAAATATGKMLWRKLQEEEYRKAP